MGGDSWVYQCSVCRCKAHGRLRVESLFGLTAAWCSPPSGWAVLVGPPATEEDPIVDSLCPACLAERNRRSNG